MRVWKRGCDFAQISIGYVLSDKPFDWLVGNMSVYQENLFQSSKNQAFSFICEIIFENTRGKLGEFSTVMQTIDCVSLYFTMLPLDSVDYLDSRP